MERAPSTDSTSTLSNLDLDAMSSARDSLPVSTSSTPPTSVTESATPSEPDAAKEKDPLEKRRSQRARNSVATYNENVVRGTAVHTRKDFLKSNVQHGESASRAVSGTTLVNDGVDSTRTQLLAGAKAPQNDWLEVSESPSKEGRRKSGRLEKLTDAASSAVGALSSATSVLGKRSRDALGSAKDKFQDMNRRTSMRLNAPKETTEEKSPAKRVRMFPNLSLPEAVKEPEPEPVKEKLPEKKPRKFWLKQGLYAGQVRESHPRQKLNKQQSSVETAAKERTYLPLPMYLGEKLLETRRDFKLSFEILNPLPRDQAPKDWRVLSKNRFIGEAAATWKKHALPMSTCLCTVENGCDEDCLNRNMQYECNDSNCDLGEGCSNRPFGELKWRSKNKNATRNPTKRESNLWGEGVEVAKTSDRGYGVRAMRSFNPGQVIVEYAGEIITQDEADRRMNEDYKGKTDFYLMTFHDGMIIDATRGSICRFVNHSCSPNSRVEKWVVAGEPRMALFAGEEGIMTGEELTYDYNFDPFSKKNIQKCLCGATNCRGVLGPKTGGDSSKLQRAASTASNIVKSAKRKLKQVIGDGDDQPSPKKKRRMTLPVAKKSVTEAKKSVTKAKKQVSRTAARAVAPRTFKKGSMSVQRTYGNRQSLLGPLKSAARSTSATKLLSSNTSLRQSRFSFGGSSLSLQRPEPSTATEPNTPVRASKRTAKPSPKMVENGKLAKATTASARSGASNTPKRSAKPTSTPSPNTRGARVSKRSPKPSPKAKENELTSKLKAAMRPGSSSASTDRSWNKLSMTQSFKSAAAKGAKGSKLAAAKIRMSLKG